MLRRIATVRWLALVAVLSLVAAACGGGRDEGADNEEAAAGVSEELTEQLHIDECEGDLTAGVTEDTIRIGSSFPQSGPFAAFASISDGYQAYFDMVNADGGVAGRQIEFVALDDAYEPGRTATNVQRLISEEDVFALFNIIGTPNNLAIWDTAEEECIPNLFAGTGSPLWGDPEHAWTVGSFPSYSLEAVMYRDYLEENDPDARVALLTQNDDFGAGYRDTFESAIEDTDIEVVAEETYEPSNTDVTSQITSLAASDADAVILGTTALACPNALNAVNGTNWEPTIFISGTCTSPLLVGLAAPGAAEGIISVTAFMDPRDPQWAEEERMQEYLDGMAEFSGLGEEDINDSIRAYGWSMGALLVHTLENAEELTRPSVMESALNLEEALVGLALPSSPFDTGVDDKYPEEVLQLMQYSDDLGYYEFLGEPSDFEDRTAEVTPESLLTAN